MQSGRIGRGEEQCGQILLTNDRGDVAADGHLVGERDDQLPVIPKHLVLDLLVERSRPSGTPQTPPPPRSAAFTQPRSTTPRAVHEFLYTHLVARYRFRRVGR